MPMQTSSRISMTKMKKIKGEDLEFKIQNSRFKIGNSRFKFRGSKFKVDEICKSYLRFSRIVCVNLILLTLLSFACVNQSLLKNKNVPAVVEENKVSDFERDLQSMKTADFDFIFAFRRKDGGVFDSEDKKYLRANTPTGTNRFVSTDEGRAFIAGSRYLFSPENIEALRSRFLVEDYSRPADQRTPENTNANK